MSTPQLQNSEVKELEGKPAAGTQASLKWLLALATLYTLYFAKPLVMPVVLALMVSLLLSPAVTACKKIRIPRALSATALVALLAGPFVLLSLELAAPAQKWVARLPQLSAQITTELNVLGKTIAESSEAGGAMLKKKDGFDFFGWFGDEEESVAIAEPAKNALVEEVKKGGIEVLLAALSATPGVFAQLTVFLVLLLFILIFGPNLYNNLVEILPYIRNKRQATVLVGRVRKQLSRYMLTVTLINAALGGATALALALLGMEDALLWGVLVGLLNFAPYVGPIVAIVTLIIAGMAQYGVDGAALTPALVFFLFNIVEAQFVTPMALGKHMRLNPLILIIWILAWGWLWGPVGVLLAVPLLICTKLAIVQLGVLEEWVRLIETRA